MLDILTKKDTLSTGRTLIANVASQFKAMVEDIEAGIQHLANKKAENADAIAKMVEENTAISGEITQAQVMKAKLNALMGVEE